MPDLAENALNIYTDGSELHGPRIGGAGFVFIVVADDGEPEITRSRRLAGARQPITRWSYRP
jgi:hypothetical protein